MFTRSSNNITIRSEPLRGWNIKACHTWKLILNWKDFSLATGTNDPEVACIVKDLVWMFERFYTQNFELEEDKEMLAVFKDGVSRFIARWRQIVAPSKQQSYYHQLEVEAILEIEKNGSIWKYTSDVTESFVHVFKQTYLRFTTYRGGRKSVHLNNTESSKQWREF